MNAHWTARHHVCPVTVKTLLGSLLACLRSVPLRGDRPRDGAEVRGALWAIRWSCSWVSDVFVSTPWVEGRAYAPITSLAPRPRGRSPAQATSPSKVQWKRRKATGTPVRRFVEHPTCACGGAVLDRQLGSLAAPCQITGRPTLQSESARAFVTPRAPWRCASKDSTLGSVVY